MATRHGRAEQEPLVFSQSAVANIWGGEAASSSFFLLESTVESVKILFVENSLDFLGGVETEDQVIFRSLQTLAILQDSAGVFGTRYADASTYLQFYQDLDKSISYDSIASTLELEQTLDIGQPIYVEAQNYLGGHYTELDPDEIATIDLGDTDAIDALIAAKSLRQSVDYQRIHYESIVSYLSPSQHAAVSYDLSPSSHIHLSQEALFTTYDNPSSQIYFTQTVEAELTDNITQELELTQEFVGAVYRDLSVSSTLSLTGSVTYLLAGGAPDYIPTPDAPSPAIQPISLCEYAPQVGSTDDTTYTPPSTTPPTLTRRTSTVLTWPYSSPTLTLEIDNPDFDNVEQFEFRRINRRSRGGTLDFYRDESWTKCKRLIMSFSGLSEIQRNDMLEFLQLSIGTEVGILDFESRQWRGLILTPTTPLEEPGKIGFSFTLEFEGELV